MNFRLNLRMNKEEKTGETQGFQEPREFPQKMVLRES